MPPAISGCAGRTLCHSRAYAHLASDAHLSYSQAQRGPSGPAFSDCELCAASVPDDVTDVAGVAAEAARHLLVTGLLRQHYLARGTCPAGVAQELFRLLSLSADQQVKALRAWCCDNYIAVQRRSRLAG